MSPEVDVPFSLVVASNMLCIALVWSRQSGFGKAGWAYFTEDGEVQHNRGQSELRGRSVVQVRCVSFCHFIVYMYDTLCAASVSVSCSTDSCFGFLTKGDTLEMVVDLEQHAVQWFVNGQPQQLVRNVHGPVRPALCLYTYDPMRLTLVSPRRTE